MIYLFILCVVIILAFATYVYISLKERSKLIELIASKDYVEYKNLNTEEDNTEKAHKNLYTARTKKEKQGE